MAGRNLPGAVVPSDPAARHLFMFGDWGALVVDPQQHVSTAMTAYAQARGIQPAAVMLLGDNFYGRLDGGVSSPRWQSQFEDMYPKSRFDVPFYALLGNHDYILEPAGKMEAQLDYAKAHPGTRWTMPAKWYRLEFPAKDPLVTFLMLDSNYQKPAGEKLSLQPEERVAQTVWLKAELAKPRTTKFLVVCGHHPLYSNAGDDPRLIAEWDALLREHSAHLYFCGHIHDLEQLELAGHPTSFVVSGGGGTTLRKNLTTKSTAANRFSLNVHGFTHLEIHDERLLVRHLSGAGEQLHAFSKTAQGSVSLL